MEPRYIVLEGIDGAGKSTLAAALTAALCLQCDVVSVVFPSSTSPVGQLIRDVLEGRRSVSAAAMMWLFVADGVDVEPYITKQLSQGVTVVCDRHPRISGLVYQIDHYCETQVRQVTGPAKFRVPDRLYLIDISVAEALRRREKRAREGKPADKLYETQDIERLRALRERYLRVVEPYRNTRILNGEQPVGESVRIILQDLEGLK